MRKRDSTLQGTWDYVALQVAGKAMPKKALIGARLLIEGKSFRVESPAETYEGTFKTDTKVVPYTIDIELEEGPAAGLRLGIFELEGDTLRICLALAGAHRPKELVSKAGSGHALEVLRRGAARDAARTRATSATRRGRGRGKDDPDLPKLQGTWSMVSAEGDGQPLPASFVETSRRIAKDDEVTVTVNGRVFLSARVELDSSKSPHQIDYALANGKTQLGIYELEGARLAFCFGRPGAA